MELSLCLMMLLVVLPVASVTAEKGTGSATIQLGYDALIADVNTSDAATVYYWEYGANPIAWRVIGYIGLYESSGLPIDHAIVENQAMLLSSENLDTSAFYQTNNYAQSMLYTSISSIANVKQQTLLEK